MSAVKPIRIAFIGAGRVADVHLEAMRALGGRAVLTGFAEVRADGRDARSREWAVPAYATVEALLRECPCDGVLILLPHDAHRAAVGACLAAGKAVLLEKPIAGSIEDGAAIAELAGRAGARLLIGHNGLFHPGFERACQAVRAGWLGRMVSVRAESAGWLAFRPWDFRLRSAAVGGGTWIDTGSHLLYTLEALVGPLEAMQCMTGRLAREEMEGEDHALVQMRFAGGAIGQIFAGYGYKRPGYRSDWPQGYALAFELSGTMGALRYELCPQVRVELFSEHAGAPEGAAAGWVRIDSGEPFSASFERQLEHFLEVAEGRAAPRITAMDALRMLRLLRCAYTVEAEREARVDAEGKIIS